LPPALIHKPNAPNNNVKYAFSQGAFRDKSILA
jgi:hypothetical protein